MLGIMAATMLKYRSKNRSISNPTEIRSSHQNKALQYVHLAFAKILNNIIISDTK